MSVPFPYLTNNTKIRAKHFVKLLCNFFIAQHFIFSIFSFIVSIVNTSFKEQLIIETVVPNEDYCTGTSKKTGARKKNFDTDINTNSY